MLLSDRLHRLAERYAEANAMDFLNPMQHDIGLRHEFIYDPGDFGPSTASGARRSSVPGRRDKWDRRFDPIAGL